MTGVGEEGEGERMMGVGEEGEGERMTEVGDRDSFVSKFSEGGKKSSWVFTFHTCEYEDHGRMYSFLLTYVHAQTLDPLSPPQLSLWLRDILDDLCRRKLRDAGDFEWQRFLRPYLRPTEGDHTHQLVLQCLEQELVYGCEFLGCQPPPVFTPRTDNYIIALTQVCD